MKSLDIYFLVSLNKLLNKHLGAADAKRQNRCDLHQCTFVSKQGPTNVNEQLRCHDAHLMMTSSNGNIFCVTGPLCGEFTGHWWIPSQRPVMRSFDVFFDLGLNNAKRLIK